MNLKKENVDYSLYLCTDREIMTSKTIEESVEKAIKGGCSLVQLREKELSSRDFYETALKVKAVTSRYNVPLIINDRVDIAMAVDAEGVHVGQSDLPASIVRSLIGEDKIVGVSAGNVEEAKKAFEDGADYIGVGAMYGTNTKKDAGITSFEELRKIRKEFSRPIVVIGGINEERALDFKGIGIDGFAVISAIVGKQDVEGAARKMRELFEQL